jgi:hypothetical protein
MLGSALFIVGLVTREVIVALNWTAYNHDMEILGRVDHGVIVPQGDASLPEGALVRIVYEPGPVEVVKKAGQRVEFLLVRTGKPGTLHLTNEMIAEIFDEEDFSPGR